MRNGRLHALLLTALLAAGCAQTPMQALRTGEAGFGALGYANLGGKAYANFQVAPTLPVSKDERKAVKLTYLMTDDTAHQSPQSLGMLRMMDDLPQKNVHNVVFRDGGDMGDSRLYYIKQADTDSNAVRNPQSLLAPNVSEVQSNNPKVFSQVLGWTLDSYPARRKYLQIYTHGGGVFGIGCDEKQTGPDGQLLPAEEKRPLIRVPEFSEALRQGLKGRKLDVIYFRACLMGNVEALYELRGTTHYALASEEVSASVDNSNLTMTKQFDDLASADAEPEAVAKAMAIQALAKNPERADGSFSGYYTFAAVDIEKMDELKSALNALALTLKASMKSHGPEILAAYDAVPMFSEYTKEMRDLWAFTAELQKRVNDKAVLASVERVRSAQRAAMLHEKDAYGSNANGLSIYMPKRDALQADMRFLDGNYQKMRFAADSGWDELLKVIAAGGGN